MPTLKQKTVTVTATVMSLKEIAEFASYFAQTLAHIPSVRIQIQSGTLATRTDGTDPTTSEGELLFESGTYQFETPAEVNLLRFCRYGSDNAVIFITLGG